MAAVSSTEAFVSLKGVSKVYPMRGGAGTVTAVSDVSLDIDDNEFVAIIGPSGCGKTTLLKLVGGLLSSSSGRIELRGQIVDSPSPHVGIVFQGPVLLPWLTVRKNVSLPSRIGAAVVDDAGRRVDDLLELVGLSGFGSSYPHELSGGMQQRAGIARALLLDPDLLLMDEPFGALDAMTRHSMNSELTRIWQARQKTVLMITHDIAEAVFLADRVVAMSARPGRIVEDIAIELPRPRESDVRLSVAFSEYVGRLQNTLGL